MKLPTREQEEAVIAADMLLTAMIKIDFSSEEVRSLIEDKVMSFYASLDDDEQAEARFLDSALTYIKKGGHN